jgi:hypothetical protein
VRRAQGQGPGKPLARRPSGCRRYPMGLRTRSSSFSAWGFSSTKKSFPLAKLTWAAATPGRLLAASSTWRAQSAQSMPSTR